MEISCNTLWKAWMLSEENSPEVIECKSRISEYTKDDWQIMSKEAKDLSEMLSELVKHSIPIDSHLARLAFNEYVEHFNKWFLNMNKERIVKTAMFCKFDLNSRAFYDQFYPGLGLYLFDLIMFNVRNT